MLFVVWFQHHSTEWDVWLQIFIAVSFAYSLLFWWVFLLHDTTLPGLSMLQSTCCKFPQQTLLNLWERGIGWLSLSSLSAMLSGLVCVELYKYKTMGLVMFMQNLAHWGSGVVEDVWEQSYCPQSVYKIMSKQINVYTFFVLSWQMVD